MDRSIKKSISANELKYIFGPSKISEDKQAKLIPALFENPDSDGTYLLKEDIRTLSDLEKKVREIIDNQDGISAILNIFSVKGDLVIPVELRDVLFSNVNLAFFVGAGVSKLLGIPLWDEIAEHAIDYLRDHNEINHSEALTLRNEKHSSKQILSILHRRMSDRQPAIRKFYENYLKSKESSKLNPYGLLFEIEKALDKPVLKISTNIDLEWEKILKGKEEKRKQETDERGQLVTPRSYYEKTQDCEFTRNQKLSASILYQIHGSVRDLDGAILTTEKYVNSYRDENGLKGFLENLFKEYVVLFIGSSIREFEILEHCLKHSPREHYALVATGMSDNNLFRLNKAYFSGIKIKALPYYLDFQGYDRLLILLQSWADQIGSVKKKPFYADVQAIDEVL